MVVVLVRWDTDQDQVQLAVMGELQELDLAEQVHVLLEEEWSDAEQGVEEV